MKKKLFQEVFNKAEKQSGKTSKHGLSSHLERVLSDEFSFPVSKMTFVRYYEKYIDEDSEGNNNPGTDLLDKMCEYLGYLNYEDYIAKNDEVFLDNPAENINTQDSKKNKKSIFYSNFRKHKITLIVSLFLIITFVVLQSINKQRWMIWQDDQYIEVSFDAEKYNIGKLKLYNEVRIEKFRQVIPSCETKFFNESGEAIIWYGKNEDGKIDFFTDLGLHPKTGKTLREITEYMIKKHICDSY